jgi:uncharacterized protein (TIGR04255 family)
MPERYKHPPLVELIAEVRWGVGGVITPNPEQAGGSMLWFGGQNEEFFMRFASKVGANGYDLVERIIPPNFMVPPGQVIYRFRQKEQTEGTTLYQVGNGVFTVNITPPYHSWEQFRPVVSKGIAMLLETRNATESQLPISNVSLRYVNQFTSEFTNGLSKPAFINDILGFRTELPASVLEVKSAQDEVMSNLQLMVPLTVDQQMAIMVAEGVAGTSSGVLMDISVNTNRQIKPTELAVMAVFDAARKNIHRVFVGTTQKITSIMQPIEG